MRAPRVLALSDVHLDYPENQVRFEAIEGHEQDTLLLPGDLTSELDRLAQALASARAKFADVFFVPGNHELWLTTDDFEDSLQKFHAILDLCAQLDVHTAPANVGATDGQPGVSVVPLFSWYAKPEEGEDSLFGPKEGEHPSLDMWMDERVVRWPEALPAATPSAFFLDLNEQRVARSYDRPVVSFSHFLPRRDLIFRTPDEIAASPGIPDRHPEFNFSRVAGTSALDRQIRRLGSISHVYGHQHRNRYRHVDGVLYISHCMGYPGEQGSDESVGAPRVVWEAPTNAAASG